MTYPKEQISHAINFIVQQLRFNDKKDGVVQLSGGQKKTISRDLSAYFATVLKQNPSQILIAPPSEKFKKENKFLAFFAQLDNEGYLFPTDTCFILEPNKTFMKQKEIKTQIYDRQKSRYKLRNQRKGELEDMLEQATLANTYEGYFSSSDDEEFFNDEITYTPLRAATALPSTPTIPQPSNDMDVHYPDSPRNFLA